LNSATCHNVRIKQTRESNAFNMTQLFRVVSIYIQHTNTPLQTLRYPLYLAYFMVGCLYTCDVTIKCD